jgi:DNA-binding MarR family transcriptional regulator
MDGAERARTQTDKAIMPVYLNQDDALALWRDALSASVRGDGPDLSARQMAILLTVYTKTPPHTVRGLSDSLNISKPAISRALDRLGLLGFVRRRRDDYDRRSIEVQRTVKGAVFLSVRGGHTAANAARRPGVLRLPAHARRVF